MVKQNAHRLTQRAYQKISIRIWATALLMALMTLHAPLNAAQAPLLEAQKVEIKGFLEPKEYARQMALSKYGWGRVQQKCLNILWGKEAAWNHAAKSPTDDYGIPQRHMRNNSQKEIDRFMESPFVQIDWGLNYLKVRYGSPCNAWDFWQRNRWY